MNRKESIEHDIQKVETAMKQLVLQQLGDKANYDSSLHELRDGMNI